MGLDFHANSSSGTLTAVNQAVENLPGIPAPVKSIVGVGTILGGYEILSKNVPAMLPAGPLRTMSKALIDVQALVQGLQLLPSVIQSISQLGTVVTQ